MPWDLLGEAIKTVGGAVALLGVPIAYLTYRQSVRTKRGEWLASLHEKFFEVDRYAQLRRILDYGIQPEYGHLVESVRAGTHHVLADDLWRYLNFFELLAGLRRLNQISDGEILCLFEYDLRLVKQHEFIMRALEPEGFDGLVDLLAAIKSAPAAPRRGSE